MSEPLIPKHGGYRKLKSFQVAQLVYDVTVRFCDRYVNRFSRTRDQMVQAARSGVQNIAEGSQASGTSKKTELKLTSVARASLEELRLDYEDFLRQRGLPLWERRDPRRAALIARRCATVGEVAQWIKEQHDGQGRHSTPSTPSTKSTPSTPAHPLHPGNLPRAGRQRRADPACGGVWSARPPTGLTGAVVRSRGRVHRAALPRPDRSPKEAIMNTTDPSQTPQDATATLVRAYLRAAGVPDDDILNRLTRQALQQIATRPPAPEETPAQRAVEEARTALDGWLAELLELPETPPEQTLAAARAALRFAGEAEENMVRCSPPAPVPAALRSAVQAAMTPAVPPPRETAMPAQPIEFWHPLGRLVDSLRRLIKAIAGARRRPR